MCSSSTPPVRGCWGLASRVPGLLAGTTSGDEIAFVDVVDTVREVHGYAKQAAAFGYTGQRGLNVRLATVCTPTAAPVIVRARLRRRDTASATGAGRLLAQAITTSRAAGATGPILARADSADDGWAVVGTALRHNVWFSVTGRTSAPVTRAIASIAERRGPDSVPARGVGRPGTALDQRRSTTRRPVRAIRAYRIQHIPPA